MLAAELRNDIQKLWDRFWSGGIANPLAAIEQIVYLIFMKRIEESDDKASEEARKENRRYKSRFNGRTDRRRWSQFRYLGGDEMLQVVRDEVFPLIKEQDREQMRDAVFIIPSPTMLQGAVEIIEKLFVSSRNADTLGDIYEFLLSEIQTSGKNGQFRTPRHIIRAIIELVNPQFNGRMPPKVCDPACGTAGFLVNSYIHLMARHTSSDILEREADGTPQKYVGDKLDRRAINALRANTFYGWDFDRTMVRVGWMNMIQHGLSGAHVAYADALSKKSEDVLKTNEYDNVFANPPFKGSIEKGDKSNRFKIETNKTELLFVDLILDLLKVGGRAGVIVPEGVLFGSTKAHRQLRQRLITENQLEAVVSLPTGVFQPYTGVKTSALIFTKGGYSETVWFYEVRADGQTLDARRQERPDENDLWDLVQKYPTRDTSVNYHCPIFHEENGVKMFDHTEVVTSDEPHAWVATAARLEENDWNLSAGSYKPMSLARVQHEPRAGLIGDLRTLESNIQTELEKLLVMVENTK